jgi:hypothetical protein
MDVWRDSREVDDLSRHNRSSIADLRVYVPSLRNDQGTHFADLLLRLLRRRRDRFDMSPASEGATADTNQKVDRETRSGHGQETGPSSANGKTVLPPHAPSPETSSLTTDASPVDLAPDNVPDPRNAEAQPARDQIALSGPYASTAIDKSQLRLGIERCIRDKEHLKRVAELPCLICSRQPSHAHHLRFAQRRGLSKSDEYVVPLCALHHGELHHYSSEPSGGQNKRSIPCRSQQSCGKNKVRGTL